MVPNAIRITKPTSFMELFFCSAETIQSQGEHCPISELTKENLFLHTSVTGIKLNSHPDVKAGTMNRILKVSMLQ